MSTGNYSEHDALIRDEQVRHLRDLAANATERARRWNLLADAIAGGLVEQLDKQAARKHQPLAVPAGHPKWQRELLNDCTCNEDPYSCESATPYDNPAEDDYIDNTLTDAQLAGAACIACGRDFASGEETVVSDVLDGQPLLVHSHACLANAAEAAS